MNSVIITFALFGLSAEEAAAFDRLGSVAILVLVLLVFMRMVKDLGNRLDKQTDKLAEILKENVKVMTDVTTSNDDMVLGQTRLHERMDGFLACPAKTCPPRNMRLVQARQADQAPTATGTAPPIPKPAI